MELLREKITNFRGIKLLMFMQALQKIKELVQKYYICYPYLIIKRV